MDEDIKKMMEEAERISNTSLVLSDPLSLFKEKDIKAVVPLYLNQELLGIICLADAGYDEKRILSKDFIGSMSNMLLDKVVNNE